MEQPLPISLCMVVRDEAEFLEDCLRRISSYVKEMIVVDTGSTDDTAVIAERAGAKVLYQSWNKDFAEARNFSIKQASQPWILVLDADEKISTRDAVALESLTSERDEPPRHAYSLIQRNYLHGSGQLTWNQSWRPNTDPVEEGSGYPGYIDVPIVRLFPNDPRIQFAGCVHESVENALRTLGLALRPSGLVLHHYGQVRDHERMRQKKNLYLELGQNKLKQEPRSARAHFELGIQQQELENFAEAVPHFLAAVNLDASFTMADLYLGICYSRLGSYPQAGVHLERALHSLPDSAEVDCELGIVALRTGHLPKAVLSFKQALRKQPDHVASLSYLGAARAAQGREKEGIVSIEKALTIAPEHRDSWVNLGLIRQKLKSHEEAIACFEKAHELKPEDAEGARLLASLLAQTGQAARAAVVLEKAVSHQPQNELLKTYWAAALAASGQMQKALEVYQAILDKGGRLGQLALQQIEKLKLCTRVTVSSSSRV